MASVDLSGTIGAPRAAGTANATDLVWEPRGQGSASVAFRRARQTRWRSMRSGLTSGPNASRVEAVIGLEPRTLTGQIDGTLPQLGGAHDRASGIVAARGFRARQRSARRHADESVVDLTVSSDGLRVADQPFQSLQSTLQLANRVVTVRTLEIAQDGGRLTASGRVTR